MRARLSAWQAKQAFLESSLMDKRRLLFRAIT
jgi:hypothetical protein